MNNPNEFLLGGHGSSDFESTSEKSLTVIEAGLAVRLGSNGSVNLTSGELLGVSIGADLSNAEKTVVCRAGNDIPMLLNPTITGVDPNEVEDFDFVVIGARVKVDPTTGKASAVGTITNAIYKSGVMDGVKRGSSTIYPIALIDMAGGI